MLTIDSLPSIGSDGYLDLLTRCLTGYLYPESSHVEVYPHPNMGRLKRLFVRALRKHGYRLLKVAPFEPEKRTKGLDWPNIGYSMIGMERLAHLQKCVETVVIERIPGDLMETGVWRGGACILMRAVLKHMQITNRTVWLADSFEGLPAPRLKQDQGYDLSDRPYLAVSMEEVQDSFRRFGLMDEQVRFIKGWFSESLPKAPVDKLALLRLDGDLYESTMDALNALYDKVSPGGFIIVDDYGTWQPCAKAIQDFRKQRRITDPMQPIDVSGVYWRKG